MAAISFSAAALGGEVCDLHDTVVAHLADKYGETRVAYGISANGGLVETFVNTKKGTWTITVTAPGGPSCMVAAGDGWIEVAPGPPKRREMAL